MKDLKFWQLLMILIIVSVVMAGIFRVVHGEKIIDALTEDK